METPADQTQESDIYRSGYNRERSTGKFHRLMDQGGTLLEVIEPREKN